MASTHNIFSQVDGLGCVSPYNSPQSAYSLKPPETLSVSLEPTADWLSRRARESVNGVSETALILSSLTADNYRAEQLSAKVASMRTVLPTFLIIGRGYNIGGFVLGVLSCLV